MTNLFLLEKIPLIENINLNLLFDKEMNLRELVDAYIQIEAQLNEKETYKITKKLRYVYEDKIISFDRLLNFVIKFLNEIIYQIEAIDSGLNLSPEFYLNFPGLSNVNIKIRKNLKKSIGNITEYKLQPYIIKLYTILTSYKGTDILQKKKYQKMIEAQEDSMKYQGGY